MEILKLTVQICKKQFGYLAGIQVELDALYPVKS